MSRSLVHIHILLPLPFQLVSNWFWVAVTCEPDTVLQEGCMCKDPSQPNGLSGQRQARGTCTD